jgi:iron complex transport system ATP-binding protein
MIGAPPRGGLVLQDLSVRLEGRSVLSGVTLEAPRGAFTALVGPNGAGKSTLLRAILARVPSAGTLSLDGAPLGELAPEARARTLAWVPQRSALAAELLVEEVVAQGRFAHGESLAGAARSARVEEALAQVGATPLRGRRFPTLSGGEQQRVLLARALATGAEVLLLDEPTAALDLGAALDVLARLRALAHEAPRVVLAAIHALPDALRFADRAVVLEEGRVRAEGPVAEVLTPQRVRDTWGVRWEAGGAPAFHREGA